MQIAEVSLRRYKSIYDASVKLSKFSVLTGPNGSGKSNFVSALGFLGDVYTYGVEYAVGQAGGIDAIAYRRTRRTTVPVQFSIRAEIPLDEISSVGLRIADNPPRGATAWLHHSFSIRPRQTFGESIFYVTDELIEVTIERGSVVDSKTLSLVSIRTYSDEDGRRSVETRRPVLPDEWVNFRERVLSRLDRSLDSSDSNLESEVESTELLFLTLSLTSVPILRDFRRQLARLRVLKLNPEACRQAGVPLPNADLSSDGANLPGVIARMRRAAREGVGRNRDNWTELMEAMAEILPDLVNLRTEISGAGGVELAFDEADVGRSWSAHEVSDGSILYLALMTAILDVRRSTLIVEEPENALHSWLLRLFIEKCRTHPLASQVIVTSHSPVVLKSVSPDDVVLVWKGKLGRTQLKPLVDVDPKARSLYENDGIDVFEQYDSGYLAASIPNWRHS